MLTPVLGVDTGCLGRTADMCTHFEQEPIVGRLTHKQLITDAQCRPSVAQPMYPAAVQVPKHKELHLPRSLDQRQRLRQHKALQMQQVGRHTCML